MQLVIIFTIMFINLTGWIFGFIIFIKFFPCRKALNHYYKEKGYFDGGLLYSEHKKIFLEWVDINDGTYIKQKDFAKKHPNIVKNLLRYYIVSFFIDVLCAFLIVAL